MLGEKRMPIGLILSALLHLGVVALILIADMFAPRSRAVEMGVSQVALIPGVEFDAAISAAPVTPLAQPDDPQAPEQTRQDAALAGGEAPPTPDDAPPPQSAPPIERRADPDAAPDERAELAALDPQARPARPAPAPQPAPRDDVRPDAPERPDPVRAPEPEAAPNASVEPPAPAPEAERAAPQAPARPAPDQTPAAARSEPGASAPQTAPPKTQPSQTRPSAPQPPQIAPTQLAAIPLRRPQAPPRPKPPEVTPPETAPQPRQSDSDAVEAALAALARQDAARAAQPAQPARGGGGRAISGATRRGLIAGIERHFSITPGSLAQRPVRYRVRLTADGRLDGRPEEIQKSGNRGLDIAALRALYDADAVGVFQPLNRQDYAGWPVVLVAFTPEGILFQ